MNKIMVALAIIIFVTSSNPAFADTSLSRERILENRINYLEERLRRIEGLLREKPTDRSNSHAPVAAPTRPKPAINQVAAVPESTPPKQPPVTPSDSHTVPDTPPPSVATPDDAPQELNILRENAVTLKPAGIEISNEVDYIKRQSNLQNDRAVLSTTSIRYGVLDWLELSATIPLGYSTRASDTSPSSAVTQHVTGFGDLVVQANARLVDQTANWPGVVLSLGMIAPTGADPYDFTHYRSDAVNGGLPLNPRNPLADYYSLGTWGVHTNLQFYKSVDPIILFLGFGADQLFPLTVSGYTVDGFTRLSYNLGLSFALSEKTTLGFSINGSYMPDLKVDGHGIFQSASEPTLARLTIIQRLMKNVYLEPSISFGLDQDAPDFILGVGVRARF